MYVNHFNRFRLVALALGATLLPLLAPGFVRAQSTETRSIAPAPSSLVLRGPLPMRNNEPINNLFLLPIPTSAAILARNRARFDFDVAVPNNFTIVNEANYYVDFEEQRYTLGYSRGIGGGQELSLSVPYIQRDGGFMDAVIDAWHHAFHFYGRGRGNVPEYQVLFRVRDAKSGKVFVDTANTVSGLGDTVLEYRRAIIGGEPGYRNGKRDARAITLSARALLKLPTGSAPNLLGSGATDGGLGLSATARPFGRVAFNGNLTYVLNGKARIDGLMNRSTSLHSVLGLEWLMDGRTSFVFEVDDSPAPNQTGSSFVDRRRQGIYFGFWRQVNKRENVYLAGGEKVGMSPDFTLALGSRLAL